MKTLPKFDTKREAQQALREVFKSDKNPSVCFKKVH